nr:hypothetical protein [Tanacetum cinerariifolium]
MGELTIKQKEDDISISQDKYVAEILKSFDFLSVTASTPIKTQKPLFKDEEGADVDVHLYRKKVVVTEDGIRHDLRLDDADGVECLPNEEIFTELACMGYEKPPPKLTFLQGFLLGPMEILDTYSCSMYKCKEDCVERIQLFNSVCCHLPCNRKKVVVTEDGIQHDLRLDDADGVECLPNEDIFTELACMGYEKPPPKLTFLQGFLLCPMEILDTYSCSMYKGKEDCMERIQLFNSYTSLALTQKVFANMRRVKKEEEVEVPAAPTPPYPSNEPSPPPQEPITTPPQTCATLSQKVTQLEQDKIAQAFEIMKLKKRVKKLEKKRRSKSSGLKRLRKVSTSQRVESSTETIVDAKTQVDLGVELQGRKDDDNVVIKDASATEPTMFDDEEVTITMVQTLIKMKAEKARLLDEQMAKRLCDEEVKQAAAREKQEKDDLEKDKNASATEPTMFDDEEVTITMVQTLIKMKAKKARLLDEQMVKRLRDEEVKQVAAREKQEKYDLEKYKVRQQQYVDKQENIDWNVVVKQMQKKHLDNIRGMTYDKVRPIFKREYNKVQTLFKPDKDVEEPHKKIVAKETLLQENFKKLKAVEVSVSKFKVEALQVKYPLIDWEIHFEGSRTYWKIIRIGEITQANQSFKDMLKDFDKEDLDALWRLVKEKFSTVVPTVDKEKALWVELKRLIELDIEDVL